MPSSKIMSDLLHDHFRRHVLRTTTKRVGKLPFMHIGFGQAQISDFDVAVQSKQDVFGFDISVDDFVAVEVAESQKDLDDVEPGHFFAEPAVSADESKKFSSGAILDDKDQVFFSLKGVLEVDNERMGGFLHDVALIHDYSLFFVFYDHLLIYQLHSIKIVVEFTSAEKDF